MLIKKSLILICCALVSGLAYAQTVKQTPKAKPPVSPAKPPINSKSAIKPRPAPAKAKSKITSLRKADQTLLWQVSGKGLSQPSFLYGTMHILCEGDARLSTGLKKVIKDCGQIFFEVDMDDMQQMIGSLQLARMADGVKLTDLLTPVEYDRIKTYFDSHKLMMPLAMMNRFKPYFITAIISEGIMDCEKKKGMEDLIMTESKSYEKNIRGLETLEFQASIFDTIPYEKQAKDLLTYIDSIDSFKQTTLEMVDVYRKQDLNMMDSLIAKSDPGMMQYMDLLLYDRNKRWAMEMPEHMFDKSTLFAVGAGHLGGEKGVINLLKEQGFTLTPMNNRD